MKNLRAEIICVGTELLLGDILNTNAQYLSRALSELGIEVYNQQVVGDNRERLAQAVQTAKDRSDIVVFSGGLGPTDDDLTKQTVAAVYNDQLVYSEEVESEIRTHFEKMNRVMTDNNKKQAFVPLRGRYLPNENGTAPGIMFIDGEKLAILLPGPPREMEPMMANQVMPILRKLVKGVIKSRYVKTMCIGESMLETKIPHFLERENPTAALYAKGDGEVTIRLTVKAEEEKQADSMLNEMYRELEAEIGEYIYGVDVENAETVIVQTLKRTMKSVAVAESCTGGKIASRITGVPGASSVFELGVCTYSDKQKVEMLDVDQDTLEKHTAVSSEVAAQMAQNVRRKAESDYALATTGYAGPDGEDVGLVYIAVATKEKTLVAKHHFAGSRQVITNLASQYALDMLRRTVLGLDIANAQQFAEFAPPKKKSKILPVFFTVIGALILSLSLAFGFLWLKNGRSWANVPVIKDFISVPTVQETVQSRSDNDFFSQGFEQITSDLVSGSWAQNLNLEGWITVKNIPAEYAIGSLRHSEIEPGRVVYLDTSTAGMPTYSGFKGESLYKSVSDADPDTEIVLFDCDGNWYDYRMFAAVSYTENEFSGLMKMSDSQDVVDEVLKKSEVKFTISNVTGYDDIIIFKQLGTDGSINLYFAVKYYGDGDDMEVPPQMSVDGNTGANNDEPDSSSGSESDEESSDSSSDSNSDISSSDSSSGSDSDESSSDTSSSSNAQSSSSDREEESASSQVKPTPTPTVTATQTPAPTDEPTPTPTPTPTQTVTPEPTPQAKTLTVTMNGTVVTDTVENILAQIVSREMTSSWNAEALKAQAIAAHTFIRYQYSIGNTAPAVSGRSTPYPAVVNAVNQVSNLIMTINGAPVYTPYFASSAGRTNSSADVWGGHYSHLVSVESKYDYQASGYQGTVRYSKADMEAVLKSIGIEPAGEPETWFQVLSKTTGGYVADMSICGQTSYTSPSTGKVQAITGRRLREDILKVNGTMVMRSHAFDISYDGSTFIITTYGYGHGVGMSQWGAQLYAQNEGWNYSQILTHYYTGVSIQGI